MKSFINTLIAFFGALFMMGITFATMALLFDLLGLHQPNPMFLIGLAIGYSCHVGLSNQVEFFK